MNMTDDWNSELLWIGQNCDDTVEMVDGALFEVAAIAALHWLAG